MTGEATAKDEARMIRVPVDHKVAVGCEGVGARLGRAQRPCRAGHPLFHRLHDRFDVALYVHLTIEVKRVRDVTERVESGFHSFAKIREAVKRRG